MFCIEDHVEINHCAEQVYLHKIKLLPTYLLTSDTDYFMKKRKKIIRFQKCGFNQIWVLYTKLEQLHYVKCFGLYM